MTRTGEESAPVQIRVARASEHGRARAAYETWGYDGGVHPADVVLVAEEGAEGGELVGVVRLTLEEGTRMLRGMQVAPRAQRRGIGTALLHALVARLGDEPCYCVPYGHLLAFYGQAGFVEQPLERAPGFLVERIARYRGDGLAVTLMRRPGAGTPAEG